MLEVRIRGSGSLVKCHGSGTLQGTYIYLWMERCIICDVINTRPASPTPSKSISADTHTEPLTDIWGPL
jgi:hypothetical protein